MITGLSRSLSLALLLLSAAGASAQDTDDPGDLEQLLELLEQQTSVATETRLNADFLPGIVSSMSGEQMQKRGFRTLAEALATLPGVVALQNETGMTSVGVRGIGNLFEPGKVKLLLNGQAVNTSAGATTSTIYSTPIELIERVEFTRGPGSAVYGEFAYAGVLDVITRDRGEQYSAGLSSDSGARFSLLRSFGETGDDLRGSFALAAGMVRGDDIESGPDRTPVGTRSYAPGPINNKHNFVSAIVDLDIEDWSMLLQLQQSNRGDHFGTNNLLPPDERQTVISDTLLTASVERQYSLSEKLSGSWSASLVQNATEQNELFLGVPENFGGLGTEDDIVADTDLVERRLELKASLAREFERHRLFGELIMTDVDVTRSEQFINLDPGTNLPTETLNEFEPLVAEGESRRSISIVLEDEFRLDDSLTLTSGLRLDDYEDIDSSATPRIALVWRKNEAQIYKAQLARAFRPPSLIEYNGAITSEIHPEINDTIEFGHIYQGTDLVVRNTLYYARLRDLILFQDFVPFGYRNVGSTTDLQGYELELEKSFGSRWDLIGSLSLQEYGDNELIGAVPAQLKLGLGHQLMPLTRLNLEIVANSERDRESGDTRDDFDAVTRVDLSLMHQNLAGFDGLRLRAGIQNLLDERLEYPAPADTYREDYPYSDGALLWLQLIYEP